MGGQENPRLAGGIGTPASAPHPCWGELGANCLENGSAAHARRSKDRLVTDFALLFLRVTGSSESSQIRSSWGRLVTCGTEALFLPVFETS